MTAQEIVAAALEINLAERAAYVRRACGDDQHLLHEAEDLLNASPAASPSGESLDRTATIASDVYEGATGTAVIGPYKLVRQLGEGGMGVVYHARQLQPIRRDVALKIIKPGMDSKQVIARFESERQALALMDHPNIAHVFDAGATSTGRPYFVMELVDGVPITRYCDSKRLNLRERIDLFIPVCQAIQHAHQKGIIHRDIKPSNVLVAEQGGKPTPKVIDFGLAKALGHQLSDATMMTNYDTVVGTFQYMSPEQAELGRHDIDTRSDVYSLGAVLYELLAGTTPLEQGSLAKASYVEILQRIREEEPAPPSARTRRSAISPETAAHRRSDPARLPKLLDGELDWITMRALEKDRTRRYETVNGLARDLERYLEGEPVEAAPPSSAYRLRKFVRKHRVWLATAAAFTALLVGGVVVSSWMAVRASRAEKTAQRRFIDVRQLANKLFDIDMQARQLSGSTLTRQLIVDTSLEYLRRLAADVRGDPELALEVGNAYMRVARVQGVPISPNLGQMDQAGKNLLIAQGFIDSVLASQPKNRTALLRSAQIAHDRMILARFNDRHDEALAFARKSAEWLEKFHAGKNDKSEASAVLNTYLNPSFGPYRRSFEAAAISTRLSRALRNRCECWSLAPARAGEGSKS